MIRLNLVKLEKKFDRKIVFSDLTKSVEAPVLGIAGINGSGKSTLLKCMAGLLKPTSGSVNWYLNNEPIKKEKLKNHLGFAAPYIQLYEELTVRENLIFIQNIRSIRQTAYIAELLRSVEAEDLADFHYGELSTGQQQRIKLVAAILHDPEILVLDEPGANLDEKGKKVVQRLIEKFSKNGRMAIIASNQKEELTQCHEIIELSKT